MTKRIEMGNSRQYVHVETETVIEHSGQSVDTAKTIGSSSARSHSLSRREIACPTQFNTSFFCHLRLSDDLRKTSVISGGSSVRCPSSKCSALFSKRYVSIRTFRCSRSTSARSKAAAARATHARFVDHLQQVSRFILCNHFGVLVP